MGYLFFSVDYPSDSERASYLRSIPPPFGSQTFGLYQPLPASATIDDWKEMVSLLARYSSSVALLTDAKNTHSIARPLKPNDDNYEAFQGPQWNRHAQGGPQIPPQLAAFLGSSPQGSNKEPTPHYDHCANCTNKIPDTTSSPTAAAPASKENKKEANTMMRCSRCKIVQYCSRDCQAQHWKKCHKASCIPAEPERSLLQALKTNDGFLVASYECQELSKQFYECLDLEPNHPKKYMIQGFAIYFQYASKLGGCFVV